MEIKSVDPRNSELWLQLITEQTSAVFHTPAWIEAVMETYSWEAEAYVLVDDSGNPVAGIPFSVINDVRGSRLVCFPFSDACDPIAYSDESWQILKKAVFELNHPVIVRSLHNQIPVDDYGKELNKNAAWHGMDLKDRSVDEIWASLHGSARRAVRKAEKSGVEVSIDNSEEAMRAYFDMHMTIRKYKYRLLAQPYLLFQNIRKHLIEPGNGFILTAKIDGKIVAANVYLIWKDILTYKFSASFPEYMNHRPTDALIWHAIQYAKEHNLNFLDFGLSDNDQDGLIRFKEKYATEAKQINFLRYEPEGYSVTSQQAQIGALFPKLTDLFTEADVPDAVTEQAGDLLYKFFV